MGAATFISIGHGKTVEEAFRSAVESARYEHGHGGYTGSVAEKSDYVVVETVKPVDREGAFAVADALLDADDSRISDKWGPAGAIRITDQTSFGQTWVFFGWASS